MFESADDFGDDMGRPQQSKRIPANNLSSLGKRKFSSPSVASSSLSLSAMLGGKDISPDMLAAMFGGEDDEEWSSDEDGGPPSKSKEKKVTTIAKKDKTSNKKSKVNKEQDSGLSDYLAVAAQTKTKKQNKQEETQAILKHKGKPLQENPWLLQDGKARRKASVRILKNRGLTRSRPRDTKTPRTRRRKQYEKALVKRRSMVQEYKGQVGGGYAGELTGIKKTLTKSIQVK
eukprot:gb/GEZN01018038.1/.p1 GENE.gb/GEZN01018038.1/~~gb/GEZN01018038.1/.p1  ORF type:complete len:231 (-),score=49.58 gb/GEZN01018038.1/:59-751(-)